MIPLAIYYDPITMLEVMINFQKDKRDIHVLLIEEYRPIALTTFDIALNAQ